MYYKYTKKLLIMAAFFFCVACESPPAYVYFDEEFDRESEFFLKGETSPDMVKICYRKDATTSREVATLARKECEKFSKRAVFIKQSLKACPLMTPVVAIYSCVK
jgi:hypothetical protein